MSESSTSTLLMCRRSFAPTSSTPIRKEPRMGRRAAGRGQAFACASHMPIDERCSLTLAWQIGKLFLHGTVSHTHAGRRQVVHRILESVPDSVSWFPKLRSGSQHRWVNTALTRTLRVQGRQRRLENWIGRNQVSRRHLARFRSLVSAATRGAQGRKGTTLLASYASQGI